MIDFQFLERLLDLLNRSNAHTIEIRKRPWSTVVKISKGVDGVPPAAVTYHVGAPPAGAAPAPDPGALAVPADDETSAESEFVEIKSPMVGTFYAQPEAGADPYVRVGGRISIGQTLCIIEAMKIMNPIDSEVSGVIKERLVDDSQPVEFGQVLFRVDPNG